jgi:hypothetical protein
MKLGYAKPDEFIFRFEDENSRGVTGPSSGSKIDE